MWALIEVNLSTHGKQQENCDFIIEPDYKLVTKYNTRKVKIIYERFKMLK